MMEPKGLLPFSQKSATCLICEPAQSSPRSEFCSLKSHFNNPPIYAFIFQVVSLPQVSLPKPYVHLAPTPISATCAIYLFLDLNAVIQTISIW